MVFFMQWRFLPLFSPPNFKAQWTGLLGSTWPNHCPKSTYTFCWKSTCPFCCKSTAFCKSTCPLCKSWKPLHYGTCQVYISHCVNFGTCLEILTRSISWRPITGYNGRVCTWHIIHDLETWFQGQTSDRHDDSKPWQTSLNKAPSKGVKERTKGTRQLNWIPEVIAWLLWCDVRYHERRCANYSGLQALSSFPLQENRKEPQHRGPSRTRWAGIISRVNTRRVSERFLKYQNTRFLYIRNNGSQKVWESQIPVPQETASF
jgi:hypothetical protein